MKAKGQKYYIYGLKENKNKEYRVVYTETRYTLGSAIRKAQRFFYQRDCDLVTVHNTTVHLLLNPVYVLERNVENVQ